MRQVERKSRQSAEIITEPLRVGRVIPVAPITITELNEYLKSGKNADELPLVKILLAQKNDQGPAYNLLVAFGGQLGSDKSHRGLMRTLAEQTTFVGLGSNSWVQNIIADPPTEFSYYINGYTHPRCAILSVIPVVSGDLSRHEIRRHPDEKVKSIVPFTPDEFTQLIALGILRKENHEYSIVGHLTLTGNDINISDAERKKQYLALNEVMTQVKNFEDELRESMISHINKIRQFAHQPKIVRLGQSSALEIETALLASQMKLDLRDERKRDFTGENSPPAEADLLKIAPYLVLAQNSKIPEMLFAAPTGRALHTINLVKRSMKESVDFLENKLNLTPKGNLYERLKQLWPNILRLPLSVRQDLFSEANNILIASLGERLGSSCDVINHALGQAHTLPQYFTDSLSSLGAAFQQHRAMNEIVDTPLFNLVIMSLGFHPNLDIRGHIRHRADQALQFEAIRTTINFLTSVNAIEMLNRADNSLIESLMDKFWIWPPLDKVMPLTPAVVHPVYFRETRKKIGDRRLKLIVDERPKKTTASLVRKMYQVSQINDIFCINIVLANENFSSGSTAEERLTAGEKLKLRLKEHLDHELAGSGWRVEIISENSGSIYANARQFNALTPAQQSEFIKNLEVGKRAGSKGNLIVRDHFLVRLSHPDGRQEVCEFNIYPFEKIESQETPESIRNSGLWGFTEKIADDAKKTYDAKRLVSRDTNRPLEPTLYEIFFPPFLYDWLIVRMRQEEITRQERTNHDGDENNTLSFIYAG